MDDVRERVEGQAGVSTAVLLACKQTDAQNFAEFDLDVWATDDMVYVSPRDGAVFYGTAVVSRDGAFGYNKPSPAP